jgi:hypothetical protein
MGPVAGFPAAGLFVLRPDENRGSGEHSEPLPVQAEAVQGVGRDAPSKAVRRDERGPPQAAAAPSGRPDLRRGLPLT